MNLEPIDTSTTAGKARVMQLAAEGRKVAYQELVHWHEAGPNSDWNWAVRDYAIIAEPVGPEEVWCVYRGEFMIFGASAQKRDAEEYLGAKGNGNTLVRYIRADLAGRDE